MRFSSIGHRKAFTLLELLVVVTIVSILLSISVSTLFTTNEVLRFKKELAIANALVDEARHAAVNNKVILNAYLLGSGPIPGHQPDTNFDNLYNELDNRPYSYVFEVVHENIGEGYMRTYARFSQDQVFNSSNDVLISEYAIASEIQVEYEQTNFDTSTGTLVEDLENRSADAVTNFAYVVEFMPPYGDMSIYRVDNPASPSAVVEVDRLKLIVTDPDKRSRTYQFLANTGFVSDLDFPSP